MTNVEKWRINTKERIVVSMGGKCEICGYNKCLKALEFHHLNPSNKSFSITDALANPKSWSKIVVELRKCVMLCSNCHREVHDGLENIEDKNYFDEKFSEYSPKDKSNNFNMCPVCFNLKPLHNITCSSKCAGKLRGKIDWENIDLPLLITEFKNAEQIGKHLKVSGSAVRKRIKNLNL